MLKSYLLNVGALDLLCKLPKSFDLLHLEKLDTFFKIIGLEPCRDLMENFVSFLNHKLIISSFVHSEAVFLI